MKHDDEDYKDNTPHDDEDEPSEFEGVYVIDDDTADLLGTAVGIIQMTATLQMGEEHRENLMIIADEIAARFAIDRDSITVEEVIHGDEILYKPRGGVMGDEEPEAEGPAVDSE